MTVISTGDFVDSSFRPSCSCSAVKSDGASGSTGCVETWRRRLTAALLGGETSPPPVEWPNADAWDGQISRERWTDFSA
jgi:hypothetical protein